MNGPWHYTEAERLLAEATEALDASPEDESPLVLRALVHATLAAAAASTVCAFSSEDEPGLWEQAFDGGHPLEAEIVETPEQSAAIVDANLARMGVTLGGEVPVTPGYAGDDEQGQVLPEAEIVEDEQGRARQDYERNRAQGRDRVESAARAILGLS